MKESERLGIDESVDGPLQVVKAALLNECTLLCAFNNEVRTHSSKFQTGYFLAIRNAFMLQ